jgi:uncharacterized protein (TIGR04222 family)
MIDMLIKIPGPYFLGIFILFSAFCIFVAWLLKKRLDDSIRYPMPSPTSLNPFEIAALRDGRKGVIQTALFNLYNRELLTITGTGNSAQVQINDSATQKPEGAIEEVIYQFANQARKPAAFFKNTALQESLDKFLEPINQKLENMHLKPTDFQTTRTWKRLMVTLFIILGVGGTKAFFDIFVYEQPFDFLLYLLLFIFAITFKVLKPNNQTALGKRFQKQLAKAFKSIKDEELTEIDHTFKVAIFGTSALSGFAAFSSFKNAFSNRSHSESGGGCGGGGCGGCGG